MAYGRYALARMTTASTGSTTSPIVLGAAVPPYKTFAQASVPDGALVRYFILDGNNSEEQLQIYTASGPSLARGTPVDGGSRITLSGTAQIVLSPGPDDFSALFDALAYNGLQINGSMEVSQENGTAAQPGITGTLKYIVDGAAIVNGGTNVVTGQQVSDAPPGYNNSLKLTVTTAEASMSAGDYCFIYMPIEGCRVSRIAFGGASAQSLSIGFWTKIHRTGTYSGSVRNSAQNRSYPFSFTQNVADTWEYKTVTIPGDTTGTWLTNAGIGLSISIAVAAGSTFAGTVNTWAAANYFGATGTTNGVAATSDVFQITGVIVLPGIELPVSTRAPLIMRPFDQELTLCKRHWQFLPSQSGGVYSTTTNIGFPGVWWPVEMRVPPTLAIVGGSIANGMLVPNNAFANITGLGTVSLSTRSGLVNFTTAALTIGNVGGLYGPLCDGFLTLNARL